MAINKKLIHFKKKENFDTEVANGNILETSICFIQDAQLIWTHGEFYSLSNYPINEISVNTIALDPNVYYKHNGTPTELTITFNTKNLDVINEYFIEFTTASSGCTLSLPASIKWLDGLTPSLEGGVTYQISIINNLAIYAAFR